MAAEDELLRALDDAAAVVAGYGAMNLYCGFDTGTEFAAELRSLRERVARHDWSALGPLVVIFAPTGAWDDGVGAPGMHLANRVMAFLDQMSGRAGAGPSGS
jgi:hypothetical protein